jgi:hypothetical protein
MFLSFAATVYRISEVFWASSTWIQDPGAGYSFELMFALSACVLMIHEHRTTDL